MTAAGAAQDLQDLAFIGLHEVRMRFWPSAWATAPGDTYTWVENPFPPAPRSQIPKEPGVYIFVVSTKVFGFPAAGGLLYIGKATNLYDRVGAYIGERSHRLLNTRRPLVWRMINQWESHLIYYYTTTASADAAKALETQMINALTPPFNRQFEGSLGPTVRAFQ